ncbi:ATP-binding protein [Spirulina sp. CCNP1310]|uniref:sensor histidine kinase n=1 Tax=Spirulina sp. CCNP1310 TaxID=3110249 RepID=UPI002B2188CD|nr:ATP-binding protein [Spirulina sp. CCNP1310]MEA5420381.1 ATP-binding protein [Spirulina sp. CCNP1310]
MAFWQPGQLNGFARLRSLAQSRRWRDRNLARSRFCGATIALTGIAVLFGWMFDLALLKSILPIWVSMKVNTALGFVASGLSLYLFCLPRRRRHHTIIATGLGGVVVMIGALSLAQYLFNVNFGIDEAIFLDNTAAVGTANPGRMAANTAFNFILLGIALTLFPYRRSPVGLVQGLTLAFGTIAGLGLVGYAYNTSEFYGVGAYTKMAVHTAIAFFYLAIGILLARPNRGIKAILTSPLAGGIMARQFLLNGTFVLLALGWLVLTGYRHQFYASEVGLALFAVSSVLAMGATILWGAKSLNEAESHRHRAEDHLKHLYHDLEAKVLELTETNERLMQETRDRQRAEAAEIQLQETLNALQSTQLQLVQSEKMSALGQLVAGVAHEINNPINFIYGNLQPAQEYTDSLLTGIAAYQRCYPDPPTDLRGEIEDLEVDFIAEDLPRLLNSMKSGAERVREIVRSLRNFSRLDEADYKEVDLHEGLESTISILGHRLKSRPDRAAIHIQRDYGEIPLVECYPGQINQVFMNVLANALDALEERDRDRSFTEQKVKPSVIQITTALWDRYWVRVAIADNGLGMDETTRSRLFDPFFTTKPVGKGTGLGLSISHQIVTENHNGQMICESQPGAGATFILDIPIKRAFVAVPLEA